jgi:hypothetical protein
VGHGRVRGTPGERIISISGVHGHAAFVPRANKRKEKGVVPPADLGLDAVEQ